MKVQVYSIWSVSSLCNGIAVFAHPAAAHRCATSQALKIYINKISVNTQKFYKDKL